MNPWNTYRSRINAHGITSATLFCSESERF